MNNALTECATNWAGGCSQSEMKGMHLPKELVWIHSPEDRKMLQLDKHKYTQVVVCDRIL